MSNLIKSLASSSVKKKIIMQQNLFTNTRSPAHSKSVYLKISIHNTNATFFLFSRHLMLFRTISIEYYELSKLTDDIRPYSFDATFLFPKLSNWRFRFKKILFFFGTRVYNVQFVSIDSLLLSQKFITIQCCHRYSDFTT